MAGSSNLGFWWDPHDPAKEFAGSLITEADRMRLSVTVPRAAPVFQPTPEGWAILHGRLPGGEHVSLLDCYVATSSWSSSGVQDLTIIGHKLLRGVHATGPDGGAPRFVSVHLHWGAIWDWFGRSGLSVVLDKDRPQAFSVSSHPTSPVEIALPDGMSLKLSAGAVTIPFTGRRHSVEETVRVTLRFPEARDVESLLASVRCLQDFLALCNLEFTHPDKIWVECRRPSSEENGEEPAKQLLELELAPLWPQVADRGRGRGWPLINATQLGDALPEVLGNWFALAESLKPVRSLYTSAVYGGNRFLEAEFLSLAQALEVFHRRRRDGTLLPDAVFTAEVLPPLQASLPYSVVGDVRETILTRLGFANEYSLVQRLRDLASEHAAVLDVLIPDWRKICKRIADTRNYLTHYTRRPGQSAPDTDTIFFQTQMLKILLELAMIAEAGADKALLHESALRCQAYRVFFPRPPSPSA
jgi:hypothetical protein